MAENDGNDPNRLLIKTLTRTMLREETETLHERIDQLEISSQNEDDGRRRMRIG